MNNLNEGSKSYHEEADIYEIFAQAEDRQGLIAQYLRSRVKGKSVLDLGCGTGKYIGLLSECADCCTGIDISADQLAITTAKYPGVRTHCCSATFLPFPDESFDAIISCWVLGTIQDESRKQKALQEAKRILRPGGAIYLVENDLGGDFEEIRGRWPDAVRTAAYNRWLEHHGCSAVYRTTTAFEFPSKDHAAHIIRCIWGPQAASKVKNRTIAHNIVIYRYAKSLKA